LVRNGTPASDPPVSPALRAVSSCSAARRALLSSRPTMALICGFTRSAREMASASSSTADASPEANSSAVATPSGRFPFGAPAGALVGDVSTMGAT